MNFCIKHLICNIIISMLYSLISGDQVFIIDKPSSGTIIIGQGVGLNLICMPSTSTIPLPLEWFTPMSPEWPITNTDMTQKTYIQTDTNDPRRKLIFVKNFAYTDQGVYRCDYWNRMVNPKMLVSSDSVTVKLKNEIILESGDSEQWLKLGSDGTIYCKFQGDNLQVSWFNGNNEIRTNERYTINPMLGLSIRNVAMSDVSVYTCRAKMLNTNLFSELPITVRVFTKPTITYGPVILYPEGFVATHGRDALLQCKATGIPMPTIQWFRKSRPNIELQIFNSQKYYVNNNAQIGKLRINLVNYNEDQDTYICRATLNSKAIKIQIDDLYEERSILLNVAIIPVFQNIDRMNLPVELYGTVTINCQVFATDSSDSPLVLLFHKWFSDVPYRTCAVNVQCPQKDPRITTLRTLNAIDSRVHNLFLTLTKAVSTDSDNYTCIAWNNGGNRTYNGSISVWHAPDLTQNNVTESYGWIRNGTNLTCISYGLPHPIWRWYRREAEVISTPHNGTYQVFSYDYERSSRSWLQIFPDYGTERFIFTTYRCNATNIKGSNAHNIEFRAASVPGIPIVRVNQTASSYVIFQVQPPERDGGKGLTEYEMLYQASTGTVDWYGPIRVPLDYSMKVHGLMPDTSYTFSIAARNIVGVGMYSTSQVRTLTSDVPDTPVVISPSDSVYPYTYTVQWRVPDNGGSPLVGYRIKVRPVILNTNLDQVMAVLGNWNTYMTPFYNPYVREFVLTELEPDMGYEGELSAMNRVGVGNATKFFFKTPLADRLGKPDRVVSIAPPALNAPQFFVLCVLSLILQTI